MVPSLSSLDFLRAMCIASPLDMPTNRPSFIASILELARHEILEVHPTRTNRDYLKALPSRSEIIPVFTILTSLFEDFWYGERPANAEDYDHFETLVGNLVDLLERDTTGEKSPSRLNATA